MANTVNKVIKVLEAEVGYLEKKTNKDLDSKTANAGMNNYTKYWRDLKASGYQGQPWCNAFVNWCFVEAYGEKTAKSLLCTSDGWSYYTPTSAGYFKNKKQWNTKPQKGDVIYFKDSTGLICHVGVVYKVDSSKVYTIEGNTSGGSTVVANGGGVAKKSYPLNYARIAGYGRPKYDKEETSTKTTTTEVKKEEKKTYSGSFPTLPKCGYFKRGDKGDEVKKLQKFLNWYAGYGLTADGDYGTNTENAVRNFQTKEKLTVDGQFGKKSLEKAKTIKK